MAAITCTLMALARSGDHLLVADNICGNTRTFCETLLSGQGVEVTFLDPMAGADVAERFQPNTRALMFEAPGSGTFEVPQAGSGKGLQDKASRPRGLSLEWEAACA